jgi:putative membrane protein insertion efficiency factor
MMTKDIGADQQEYASTLVHVHTIPQRIALGLIKGYQRFISPMMGQRCKYYPSCSRYGLEAIQTHGLVRGTGLTIWRILRCNPWSNGGVDDVPPAPAGCRRKNQQHP